MKHFLFIFVLFSLISISFSYSFAQTPQVVFTKSTYEGIEGEKVRVQVSLPVPVQKTTRIKLGVQSGTARSGADFFSTSPTLIFYKGGLTTKSFFISLKKDSLNDDNENATIYIDSVNGKKYPFTNSPKASLLIKDSGTNASSSNNTLRYTWTKKVATPLEVVNAIVPTCSSVFASTPTVGSTCPGRTIEFGKVGACKTSDDPAIYRCKAVNYVPPAVTPCPTPGLNGTQYTVKKRSFNDPFPGGEGYGFGGSSEAEGLRPNETFAYEFTAPGIQSLNQTWGAFDGFFEITQLPTGPGVGVPAVSISECPGEFYPTESTKNKDGFCFVYPSQEAGVEWTILDDLPYSGNRCKLVPGRKYYLNVAMPQCNGSYCNFRMFSRKKSY